MRGSKKTKFIFHVMVWMVLFCLPYILSSGQQQIVIKVFAHSWIPLIMYIILFYLNYFGLIDWFLLKKKVLLFILINCLVISIFLLIRNELNTLFFDALFNAPLKGDDRPTLKLFIYIQIISFVLPIAFAIALKTTERWLKTEAERKEAANAKLQSELQHLRYQLQPHFFFNSLNNIYSLVDVAPDQAKSTIHSLSKLMRYLLYETNTELVPLTNEIDFMRKYMELMKLRISDKTKVASSFPIANTSIQIAPLLFISLIENAFKHGVSATKESVISLEMKVQDNHVFFTIENNNFPKEDTDKSGSGIGLQNLQKRLELLYPNKHKFKTSLKEGIYSISLKIET